MRSIRRLRTVGVAALALVGGVLSASALQATAAGPPRVDLNVLVVTDGNPWVEAIRQQLSAEGVPTTIVDLASTTRPQITSAYLSDVLADGTPHAHFEGVVLPSDAPSQLSATEKTALSSYEQSFKVRQVDSYVYPNANVGLNTPVWSGSLDATTATATASARADAFRYLNGPVAFEGTAGGSGSYGYLATPLPDDPTTGAHFEPYVTETVAGTSTTGTVAGVFTKSGREQLEISFAYNYYQQQYRLLAHGIVDWVTKGVHLGYWRNYFSAHIDDLFNDNSRWSQVGHCTPGAGDCAAGVPATTPIRMTPADVTNAVTWQQQNNYQMDFLFNASASVDYGGSTDPVTNALLANKSSFWWVNHTYTHTFLGCVQDFTVIPWRCQTDAAGKTMYLDQATINNEIANNVQFATANGLPIRANELVAGEHSGTYVLPQQPNDNPNFLAALTQNGINWVGLDASREKNQRQVASALGTPRHPINVFYNVSTQSDEISEYNWIYTSKANGGSGYCEANPATTTCITPLDPVTGWSNYILPQQIKITLGYVLSNDPRPFFMHQSNLTDDRLALQALSGVLSTYRNEIAANAPAVDQTLTDAGKTLQRQDTWAQMRSAGTVSGYVQGGTVTVQGPSGASVPITMPAGSRSGVSTFGEGYAGEQSAYTTLGSSPTSLTLPAAAFALKATPTTTTVAPVAYSDNSEVEVMGTGTAVTIRDSDGDHVLPKLAAEPEQQINVVACHRHLRTSGTDVVAHAEHLPAPDEHLPAHVGHAGHGG